MSKQSKRLSPAGSVRHARVRSWLIMGLAFALLVTLAAGAQGLQPATAAPSPAPLSEQDTAARLQASQNVEFIGQIGGVSYAVAVSGNLAYVGVGPRLVILNIADPTHPAVIGQTSVLPAIVRGVAVAGNYAYVADQEGGLRIINVANPAVPTEVGFYDTPGYAQGVAVTGGDAYVADGDGGLRIIDVANPAAPTEAGFYPTGWATGVAVAGSYAYIAEGESGLRIINVAHPAAPTEVGFYDTPGFAKGVAVAGGDAYVADGDGGLVILRFTGAPTPIYLPVIVMNWGD